MSLAQQIALTEQHRAHEEAAKTKKAEARQPYDAAGVVREAFKRSRDPSKVTPAHLKALSDVSGFQSRNKESNHKQMRAFECVTFTS